MPIRQIARNCELCKEAADGLSATVKAFVKSVVECNHLLKPCLPEEGCILLPSNPIHHPTHRTEECRPAMLFFLEI